MLETFTAPECLRSYLLIFLLAKMFILISFFLSPVRRCKYKNFICIGFFVVLLLVFFFLLRCSVMFNSATPWFVAHQASLSMGFSWPEYWSGLPFPLQRGLPVSGIGPSSLMSPALAGGFLTASATWEALHWLPSL